MIAIPMPPPSNARWSITGPILTGWRIADGQVLIRDGAIAASAGRGARRLRLPEGWIAAPGFWDLQVNGFAGAEIADDPVAIARVATALPAHGVTAFCPTLVSRTPAAYRRAGAALVATRWPEAGARHLGVHLEGPFLSPRRAGAHPPTALALPDPARLGALVEAFRPRIITLAPELEGGLAAIAALRRAGVIAAVGHTEADAELCTRAIGQGARLLVHAFNAMPGLAARAPGPVGAFLAARQAHVAVIADGVHVAEATLAVLAGAAGRRLVAVSDAVAAAGAPAGTYALAGRRVTSDGGAVRDRTGHLAGSASSLAGAPAMLHAAGRTRAAALATVVSAPRRLLGAPDPLGLGAVADLVILDDALRPRATLIGGAVVWQDPAAGIDLS
jgi:N-acetylglucosamine-6-phosphate deacetylase